MHWNLFHFYSTFTKLNTCTWNMLSLWHSTNTITNIAVFLIIFTWQWCYGILKHCIFLNKLYSKTPMQLCIDCQWESGLSLQILFLIFFVPLSGSAPGVQLKNLLIHLDVIWSYSSQCLYIKCVEVLDCNASVIVVTSRSAIHKDFLLLCIKCKLAYWINSPKEISQDASGRERRLLLLNFLFKWDFIFVWPFTTTSPECTDFQNKA